MRPLKFLNHSANLFYKPESIISVTSIYLLKCVQTFALYIFAITYGDSTTFQRNPRSLRIFEVGVLNPNSFIPRFNLVFYKHTNSFCKKCVGMWTLWSRYLKIWPRAFFGKLAGWALLGHNLLVTSYGYSHMIREHPHWFIQDIC